MGHDPGKTRHVGDGIVRRDIVPALEMRVQDAVQSLCLARVAIDRIGNLLRRIEQEVAVLAEHRAEPGHLPHQPLQHLHAPAHVGRQKAAGLFREVDQDGAALENAYCCAAVGGRMVCYRRHPAVGTELEKFRLELVAATELHRHQCVRQPAFLQHDGDLPAVRRRRVMQVDHGFPTLFSSILAPLGRRANAYTRRAGHGR